MIWKLSFEAMIELPALKHCFHCDVSGNVLVSITNCVVWLINAYNVCVSGGRPRGEADVVPQHREGDLSGRGFRNGVDPGIGKCHAR